MKRVISIVSRTSKKQSNCNTIRQWTRLTESHDEKWREVALSLMQRFCESTNGSFTETKESAVLWQFKDADPVSKIELNEV